VSAAAETAEPRRWGPNRLAPLRFILAFGVVSMLGDFVYEGARSVVGPYLATLGASAALVGFVTGAGEAVALVFRLASGRLSDRTGRHWTITIAGYAITFISVPLLAVTSAVAPASALVVGERFGKAVRTPARDTMLAEASADMGRGRAFALHEAMDQTGALVGPLVVALMVAISGYKLGFAVLAVPAAAALVVLGLLRRAVPAPSAYERKHALATTQADLGEPLPRRFWLYALFTAISVAGFATFGVLGYHLQVRHVVPEARIPIIYAVAMGVAALAALGSGVVYDRFGLRGLVVMPVLTAAVPFLSFSTTPALVWVGAAVWGAAVGIHESTMRAAVTDLVPAARRGAGYGTFTAVYGLAWLGGGTLIGVLYGSSVSAVEWFVVATQVAALGAFLPLLRRG
jgi:MFS family permease